MINCSTLFEETGFAISLSKVLLFFQILFAIRSKKSLIYSMKHFNDRGYKWLLSNKVIFRQLIETFVKEAWVPHLDFSSCEKIDKLFIAEHYKKTESDVIYKIKLKDKESYICILMEFQSTVERFMAFRVANYISNFYMDVLKSNKGVRQVPAVFPIVLYNGEERWSAPDNTADLIQNHLLLGDFGLRFRY